MMVPDNVLFEDNTGQRLRMADRPLQPAHHPAPADWYLLCAFCEDQCVVLSARQDR